MGGGGRNKRQQRWHTGDLMEDLANKMSAASILPDKVSPVHGS